MQVFMQVFMAIVISYIIQRTSITGSSLLW